MEPFTCVVCFEDKVARVPLGKLSTTNGNIVRGEDCGHPICETCMAAFVTARVEEQMVFGIRCPFDGCKQELQEQDIQALTARGLVSPDVQERMAKLRHQTYADRTAELEDILLSSSDAARSSDELLFLKTLWESTRKCPRCGVLMQKSEGCDSFGCICGHRFNFANAPRGCGDGIHNFDHVTYLAARHAVSVRFAISLVQEGCKRGIPNFDVVTDLAAEHRMSVEDVMGLVEEGVKHGLQHQNFSHASHLVAKQNLSLVDAMSLVQDGCKKGIRDFDIVTDLAAEHCMSVNDVMDLVEEGLKNGLQNQNFSNASHLVAKQDMSFADAIALVQDGYKKGIHDFDIVTDLADVNGLPLQAAIVLVEEGTKKGITDFGIVSRVAAEHNMPCQDAVSLITEGLMKGIRRYESVLAQAERLRIPLSAAEVYVQAHLGQDVGVEQLRETRLKPRRGRKLEKELRKARTLRCMSL